MEQFPNLRLMMIGKKKARPLLLEFAIQLTQVNGHLYRTEMNEGIARMFGVSVANIANDNISSKWPDEKCDVYNKYTFACEQFGSNIHYLRTILNILEDIKCKQRKDAHEKAINVIHAFISDYANHGNKNPAAVKSSSV